MNRQEVDKEEFWRERLRVAKQNNLIHVSVYMANATLWKQIREAHEKIIALNIPHEARVLDAGCGYGRASEWFENYVGVDFSPDFLEEARRRYPNKKFIQADLKKLPFADKVFDWAVCISIKEMIKNNLGAEHWDAMEKELKRVAHKVLLLEYGDKGPHEEYNILQEGV